MTSNYDKSLAAIKAKNGGELPSDLYLFTIAELRKMLVGLTGDNKHLTGRDSKETLVTRILKLTESKAHGSTTAPSETTVVNKKRKASETDTLAVEPAAKKIPRNCLATLTPSQVAQMKRVLATTHDQMLLLKHEQDLKPLWSSIGMTAKYPGLTGKEGIFKRLTTFAENNLRFHGHIV